MCPRFATGRGIGEYVASEAHTVAWGRLYKKDATTRPLIYFTGGPGDDRDFLTSTASGSQLAPRLAEIGVPIISAAFGGGGQWGNDTAQSRIGSAFTFVQSRLGTKTDKFVGIGVSKGATALLNYARNNPTLVAALLLIVPAVNVADIHDNNRSGLATEIENAYGGAAGWTSAAPTHDPAQSTAAFASMGLPVRMHYGANDTTVLPSVVQSFATATGFTAIQHAGTDHLTTGPTLDPVEDAWKFLATYL
jgi:hypothetical protein